MKKNVTTSSPAATTLYDSEPGLSVRQWLVTGVLMVLLCVSMPRLWQTLETFNPGEDYRLPYALSDDYWLYERYCKWSVDQDDVMVIGDSVVWGHYVPPDGALSHHLNQMPGGTRTFANLGIDGIHPAAMAGLLKYYGRAITGKTVILSFNPLWMT
ncbi:MAG: hypothetical protein GY809_31155, partial [Planctomycetes bacterium]|nr:hypothetical protein [Planctomycetota bacterium]